MTNTREIAEQFMPTGSVLSIKAFGNGNINKTYLVETDLPGKGSRFILQQINNHVFVEPERVVDNMDIVTNHLVQKLIDINKTLKMPWQVPCVLKTIHGEKCIIAPDGSCFRALQFINNSETFEVVKDLSHAEEVGYSLGLFHQIMHDMPTEKLLKKVKILHETPLYLQHYLDVSSCKIKDCQKEHYCREIIDQRKNIVTKLDQAKKHGRLTVMHIHGDPKINNIMMDITTGFSSGMVDLDTVQTGPVQYDIGDCLRSACNPLGEETLAFNEVYFNVDFCSAILRGYVSRAGAFLKESDFDSIYDAVRLIAFELGIRFFTDYLEGNRYFRSDYPEHNLNRAMVQFKLVESIESQVDEIVYIIEALRQ